VTLSEATGIRQRLAAILAADVAGYSRLMAHDEQATVVALDAARDAFRTAIRAHNGRVIDMAGDSVLAVFETAASAVSTALDVQEALDALAAAVPEDRRMRFRIGVHVGDLIEKPDGSVYGDGVNIASRLQALALPGAIAVSDAVRGLVRNRVPASFEDLGEQQVKNIAEPVHAFRTHPDSAGATAAASDRSDRSAAPAQGMVPTLTRRWTLAALVAFAIGGVSAVWWVRSTSVSTAANAKSIAVLPFVDMSEKHDQEYFSDGLSEELIDHLTHAANLKVIARTSSFQFKGKNEDIRLIAKKLGVANLLEGSVRKSGSEVRITAQLIRAEDGAHIWSQTYNRDLKDIFKVQDDIARTVAHALQAALRSGGRPDSPPSNTQAYNLLLEGDFFAKRWTKADIEKAIELYKEAIKLEPNYARAWVNLGDAYSVLGFFGLAKVAEAREAVDHALRIDPDLPMAYAARGSILKYFDWDWLGAEAAYRRASELSPDDGWMDESLASIGWMFGQIDKSIAAHRRRLERDPLSANSLWGLGLDLFMAGRYEEAAGAFRKVSELNSSYASAKAFLAMTLLFQGKKSEALTAVEQEPDQSWRFITAPMVYWDLGRRRDSDAALSQLENSYADSAAYQIGEAHAYRGEVDAAFDWLERAYRQHDPGMTWTKVDPVLRNLHSDPRYHALLVKLKLDGDGHGPRQ
jgi:TolB-like protein/class 3 adenylate cyclase/Flp pilus assembly protein TadD